MENIKCDIPKVTMTWVYPGFLNNFSLEIQPDEMTIIFSKSVNAIGPAPHKATTKNISKMF